MKANSDSGFKGKDGLDLLLVQLSNFREGLLSTYSVFNFCCFVCLVVVFLYVLLLGFSFVGGWGLSLYMVVGLFSSVLMFGLCLFERDRAGRMLFRFDGFIKGYVSNGKNKKRIGGK